MKLENEFVEIDDYYSTIKGWVNKFHYMLGIPKDEIQSVCWEVVYELKNNEKGYVYRTIRNRLIDILRKGNNECTFSSINDHFDPIGPNEQDELIDYLYNQEILNKIKKLLCPKLYESLMSGLVSHRMTVEDTENLKYVRKQLSKMYDDPRFKKSRRSK